MTSEHWGHWGQVTRSAGDPRQCLFSASPARLGTQPETPGTLGTKVRYAERERRTEEVQVKRRCGELLARTAETGERATKAGNVNPATAKVSNDATPCPPTLAEVRHDNVKRTIENLAERGAISLPPMGEVAALADLAEGCLLNSEAGYAQTWTVLVPQCLALERGLVRACSAKVFLRRPTTSRAATAA